MFSLAGGVARQIKRSKSNPPNPDVEATKISPMTNACAEQEQNTADKTDRDPNRRTNPLLVESVLEEKSDPDDQDQHTYSEEPFLANRHFGRRPFLGDFLRFGLGDRQRREGRRHSSRVRSAGQFSDDF